MRKGLAGVLMLSGALFILSSCKDDPDPISGISFEITEQEVNESDGTLKSFSPLVQSGGTGVDVKVKLVLDQPAPDKIVLAYTVSGTTDRIINTTTGYLNDFNLNGANAKESETLIIEKGSTEAIITLTVFEDDVFEIDNDDNLFETVILTLDKVETGPGKVSETSLSYTLKINEDDAAIILQWTATPEEKVDMDLFIWLDGQIAGGAASKDYDYESSFIPAGYPDGNYGLSYTYYSGTSNSLKFGSYMFGRSLNGKSYLYPTDDPLPFSGTYTQANINTYDLNADLPATQIVQTITKSKTAFTASALTPLSSGSRISGTTELPKFSLSKLRSAKLLKPISK